MIHPISDVTESTVIMSKAYPVIRELVHKYKLKVVGSKLAGWNSNVEFAQFYMARDDGMILGTVGVNREGQYFFRSVIHCKERGRVREDRYTYLGLKPSSLMRSIDKNMLIPSRTEDIINRLGHVREAVKAALRGHDNVNKSTMMDGAEMHDILKVVFGYQDINKLPIESINKFRKVLDSYNEVDKTREDKLNLVKEKFDKPIKFLMYDDTKTFLKGSMKVRVAFNQYYNLDETIVESVECQRVRTFMDDTDISPLMAMLKVKMQQDETPFAGDEGFFPLCGDKYIEELGIVKVDTDGWRHDNYPGKPQWLFFV